MLLLCCMLLPSSAWGMRKPSVLFLNSYHNGYRWSDNILEGVRRSLEKEGMVLDLYIEYIDAKRHNDVGVQEANYRLFKEKYPGISFDVVIASDNNAFDFVTQHYNEFFKDTPIVFCGVNDFKNDKLQGMRITGVVEDAGIKETLDVAIKLHPNVERVVVVGDDSVTGHAIRAQVQLAAQSFVGKLDFDYWHTLPFKEILKRAASLPEDTILFFIPSYFELDGQLYDPAESQSMLAEASPRPIYSSWSFLLGHGIIGGKMASGLIQGEAAGKLVAKILAGQNPSDIPIVEEVQRPYQYDYIEMKRFGIHEAELPPGSEIINAPKVFYEISRDVLWTLGISFVLLSLALMMLVVNILRRKRIEGKIINQLSFQELLMDTIPQLVCWKDRRQRYLGANRTFAKFFGIDDPQELIDKNDSHIIKEGYFSEWFSALDREVIFAERPIVRQRISLSDQEGEQVWLEVNKVPLRDASGNVVGSLSTAENVTREINLERQLLQSQKMEAIGALAGGIAHDFNNILTSIMNSTELALMDVEEKSDTGKDLKRVLRAADRGKRLVQQILAFSRPSQEGFRPTDLAELVRETVGFLQPSLPRNISINHEIDVSQAYVMVDPTQIYQVLMNLCTNAFQAMRDTGGLLQVRLDELSLEADKSAMLNMRPGQCFRLSVSDDGPGVPPELLDKIFDPFFTTKGKKEGTGLGLAVVLGIVKNHGGAVQVRSTHGPVEKGEGLKEKEYGATFEVFIPARIVASDTVEHKGMRPMHGQGRILFVEDDKDQLATVPRVLQSLGYKVIFAGGAGEALAVLEEDSAFDLVITDFDMPETNGAELAHILLSKLPGVPVILASGRAQAYEQAKNSSNIRLVLPKPFSKSDLFSAIREVL